MAWTSESNGTLTADGTEQTLATVTSGSDTYILVVDLENMVNGDEVTLRIKTTVLSAGNENVIYAMEYADDQGDVSIVASIPVPGLEQDVVFTLEQTAGTNRNYDWEVLSQ